MRLLADFRREDLHMLALFKWHITFNFEEPELTMNNIEFRGPNSVCFSVDVQTADKNFFIRTNTRSYHRLQHSHFEAPQHRPPYQNGHNASLFPVVC